jgi:PAS domain S-box-containing protein
MGQWLATMLKQARDYAVLLMDPHGIVVAWLESAEHVFGYTSEEAVGRHFEFIFTEEDRLAKLPAYELAVAAATGQAQDDRWHVRKDASRLWTTGAVLSIRSPDGELLGYGKMLRDRTDLRAQIETLKTDVRELAHARRAQEAFLGVLAHELRNPLAPLKSAAEIASKLAEGSTTLARPLQVIERQIAAIQRLLEDLMDMARSNVGKLRLQPQRLCLQEVLAEAYEAAKGQAEAAGVPLHMVVPEVPLMIDLDKDRFQQIIANLLNNAIKYSPGGGRVWLKANLEPGHAVIRVEDNGEGIAPELQPKIFELFTQGPGAQTGRGSGLGIGLALVKELVSLHHGSIAVRSEGLGKGAEFTVRIPLTQPCTDDDAAPT